MRRVDGSLFNPHNDSGISITGAAPRGRYTGGEKILGLAELIIPRILRGNGLIQVVRTIGIHGVKIFLSIHGTNFSFLYLDTNREAGNISQPPNMSGLLRPLAVSLSATV